MVVVGVLTIIATVYPALGSALASVTMGSVCVGDSGHLYSRVPQ